MDQLVTKSNRGRPPQHDSKETHQLAARVGECVLEHCELLREQIRRRYLAGWRPNADHSRLLPPEDPDYCRKGVEIDEELLDELQPLVEDYDPVVQLAMLSIDQKQEPALRRQAASDAAQYLRPKLKSIELLEDPQSLQLQEEKNELASRLVGLLDSVALARSREIEG